MILFALGFLFGLLASLALYLNRERIAALCVSKLQQVEKKLNPPKS